jgi:hypothetical protein
MKKINNIVLLVLFAISIVMIALFFGADTESVQLTTGQYLDVSTFLDPFLYWTYAIVILGIICLVVFAVKAFISDPKGSLGGVIGIGLLVALGAICYAISGETEFSRIVNGETEVYSETMMKCIDMFLYCSYVLILIAIVTALAFLIAPQGVLSKKRATSK